MKKISSTLGVCALLIVSIIPESYSKTCDVNWSLSVAGVLKEAQSHFQETFTYKSPDFTFTEVGLTCSEGNFGQCTGRKSESCAADTCECDGDAIRVSLPVGDPVGASCGVCLCQPPAIPSLMFSSYLNALCPGDIPPLEGSPSPHPSPSPISDDPHHDDHCLSEPVTFYHEGKRALVEPCTSEEEDCDDGMRIVRSLEDTEELKDLHMRTCSMGIGNFHQQCAQNSLESVNGGINPYTWNAFHLQALNLMAMAR